MRVDWIDALKGVAILMVVTVHVSQAIPMPEWAKLVGSFGAMGVQLFFLLSAYCLCMTWKGGEPFTAKVMLKWLLRKYRRLAPWYLAGVAIYAVIAWIDHGEASLSVYSPANIVANCFFVNGFVSQAQNSIVPGGWSISCIALFAFAFPMIRRLNMATLLLVGIFGCAVSIVGYQWFGWSRFYAYCVPFNQFIVFVLGICLYKFRDRVRLLPGVVMALLFCFLAVVAVVFGREYNIFYRHILMAVSFWGLASVMMCMSVSWWRGLLWIGQHSYEIFILHFAAIWGAGKLVLMT